MTFSEIGKELRISAQCACMHYMNAIRKLRRSGRMKKLRELAKGKERKG
jgi:hypothetical protein